MREVGLWRTDGFPGGKEPGKGAMEFLSGRKIDGRSDLFPLGVTLYRMACGPRARVRQGPAFKASTAYAELDFNFREKTWPTA